MLLPYSQPSNDKDEVAVRFAVLNTVPPGFCRKMHILAPGGRLDDLAVLTRDELPLAGLSPTHMEAIQSFREWQEHGITPALGLLMWYLESEQQEDGSFLREEGATAPSVGVAIRFLQIAGTVNVTRSESPSVDRAATWLESQIGTDGLIRLPTSGTIDFGMLARTIKALHLVNPEGKPSPQVEHACRSLSEVAVEPHVWSTYPGGRASTGATALVLSVKATCAELFDEQPDPWWLLNTRNPDGGWGEYGDSPVSKVDNTFWAARACVQSGHPVMGISSDIVADPGHSPYESAMAQRLRVLVGHEVDGLVADLAMKSLTEDADRYAETVVYGLALAEPSAAKQITHEGWAGTQALPLRTPDFLRREPPLYDQLNNVSSRSWWARIVDRTARLRVAESSIGWLAGVSAALAIVGTEVIDGLSALPLGVLAVILVLETLIGIGWLGARQGSRSAMRGVPHLVLAGGLAALVVLLVTSPADTSLRPLSAVALGGLLALIIEVVAVATDKADLLNRLDDD